MSEPVAKVERIGRFTFRVWVEHGLMQYGINGWGWVVWGRQRAERKARRVLAAYLRREGYRNDVREVEPNG